MYIINTNKFYQCINFINVSTINYKPTNDYNYIASTPYASAPYKRRFTTPLYASNAPYYNNGYPPYIPICTMQRPF